MPASRGRGAVEGEWRLERSLECIWAISGVISGDAGSVLAGDAPVMLSDGFHGNGGGRAGSGDDGSAVLGSRGSAVNWVGSVVYWATCA